MALYGHEIHASITPFEADLGWIVKLDKGEFIGREALRRQKEQGVRRKLIGYTTVAPKAPEKPPISAVEKDPGSASSS